MENTTNPEAKMWDYGMYGSTWGTVEATSEKEAAKKIRAKYNLRTTKGMFIREAEAK